MSRYLLIILFSIFTVAAQANQPCLEISEPEIQKWMSIQPPMPSFFDLYKAKKIIDAEQKTALKLGNDKRAHCYLGCRISDDIDYQTADYVGWQKEFNDATDCNPNTRFDKADYVATLVGAKKSKQKNIKSSCATYCKKKY